MIDGAIYIVLTIGVVIFFFITRYRIQSVFDRINKGLHTRRDQKLKLATGYLQAIVALGLVWILCIIIIGTTNLAWSPAGFATIWWVFYMAEMLVSLFQVIIIHVPHHNFLYPLSLSTLSSDGTPVTSIEPRSGRTAFSTQSLSHESKSTSLEEVV